MGALKDDQPQFQEVTGDALTAVAAEYKRVWGEDMPTADSTPTDDENDEK